MIERPPDEVAKLFESPQLRAAGCKRNGSVTAYLLFSFQPDKGGRWLLNDLVVRELVYDTPEDLAEILTFLHTQADQIRSVIWDTQDDCLHFLPIDPRNGSDEIIPSVYHVTNWQGVGLMYRVLDAARVFGLLCEHDFAGLDLRLRVTVEDSLLPENSVSTIVVFRSGHPEEGGRRVGL